MYVGSMIHTDHTCGPSHTAAIYHPLNKPRGDVEGAGRKGLAIVRLTLFVFPFEAKSSTPESNIHKLEVCAPYKH